MPYFLLLLLFLCNSISIAQEKQTLSDFETRKIAKVFSTLPLERYPSAFDNKSLRATILKQKLEKSCSNYKELEKNHGSFLRTFLKDEDWLYGFLGSGSVINADRAIELLESLCKYDRDIARIPLYKKLATALALEFARWSKDDEKREPTHKWDEKNIIFRYDYYKSSHKKGLLNSNFNSLTYSEMRHFAGHQPAYTHEPRDHQKYVSSLAWLRDNYRLPPHKYRNICWVCPYRSSGLDMYSITNDLLEGGWPQKVRDFAGVCAQLSPFGTMAALANGVPAISMFEAPNHCSYAVRIDKNKWLIGYSVYAKRFPLDWKCEEKNTWLTFLLADVLYSNSTESKTSNLLAWTAEILTAKDPKLAQALYQQALKVQPLNYPVWKEYLKWEHERDELTIDQLKELSSLVCSKMAPDYPETAWYVLHDDLYPILMPKLTSISDKVEELKKFHSVLGQKEEKEREWDYTNSLTEQLALIYDDGRGIVSFMEMLIPLHSKSKKYFISSFVWCYEQAQASEEIKDKFFALIQNNDFNNIDTENSAIKELANTIIKEAEKTQNMEGFQLAGKITKDLFPPSLPEFEPFPGELLSSGGMLQTSSSAYESPWTHWGVLESCGGVFHTREEDPAWVRVTMPLYGDLSGIVIISRAPHDRGNGTIIETSSDMNTWTQIGKIEKMQEINRIDLQSQTPKAKYIRLTRPGKNYYHLRGILIYGKRSA